MLCVECVVCVGVCGVCGVWGEVVSVCDEWRGEWWLCTSFSPSHPHTLTLSQPQRLWTSFQKLLIAQMTELRNWCVHVCMCVCDVMCGVCMCACVMCVWCVYVCMCWCVYVCCVMCVVCVCVHV